MTITSDTIICDKCGKDMVERNGKFGEFYGCSGFPDCRNTKQKNGNGGSRQQKRYKARKQVKRELKKITVPTEEQAAAFAALDELIETGFYQGVKNFIIEATAGSGKTSVVEHMVMKIKETIKFASIIYLTFDKRSQEEAEAKGLPAKTIHSKLLNDLRRWAKTEKDIDYIEIRKNKMYQIVTTLFKEHYGDDALAEKSGKGMRVVIGPTLKLIEHLKTYGYVTDKCEDTIVTDPDKILTVSKLQTKMEQMVFDAHGFDKEVAVVAYNALAQGNKTLHLVNFDDMVYLAYIYGIPVETYDWVFADELQDLSSIMGLMVLKALDPHSVFGGVGDRWQSIYGFRGADIDSIPNLIKMTEAATLPMTISFRLPQEGERLINTCYPDIPFRVWKDNEKGEIREMWETEYFDFLNPGDIVICRINKHLVEHCLGAIKRGIRAKVLGRNIGAGLIRLIERFENTERPDETAIISMMTKLRKWTEEEIAKCRKHNNKSKEVKLNDDYDVLDVLVREHEPKITRDLKKVIHDLFEDDTEGFVTYTTIHKIKGGEADHVFIIHNELNPHPYAKTERDLAQEYNMGFVKDTRFKKTITFVANPHPESRCPVMTTREFEKAMVDIEETEKDATNWLFEGGSNEVS